MTSIRYFGYGSNMDFAALKAKGVTPIASCKASLPKWRLRFNVMHFFRHEGGVGNIEETGRKTDSVQGVLHICEACDLAALDKLEGLGVGYNRIEVSVRTEHGAEIAQTYVGLPAFLGDDCLPTRRYLNILIRGATAAGLAPAYIAKLRRHPTVAQSSRPAFVPPHLGTRFDHTQLEPHQTVLAGHVFCMREVRFAHELARTWFGGKDVTQFHLRRMDKSTGTEQLSRFLNGEIDSEQREFLNTYLHAFDEEYRYLGRFDYAGLPQSRILA